MARPARSPLLGYNHNVKYGGHIFHVQTEDSGPANPHLFTHLFFEGSILASKRGQYDPALPEEEVRGLMQAQHKAILKELKQTVYDERITRFFSLRGVEFPAPEFFTPEQETPTPVVATEALPDETVPTPTAPEEEVLDLDALPATPANRPGTPEPLPIHFTKPSVPGPGTYTLRRPAREVVEPERPAPPARPRPGVSGRPAPGRPVTPVLVQRQIVVGAGAPATVSSRKAPTTPVRRRPVSGGPFVVKEGSHVEVANSTASRKAEPAPRSLTPAPDASRAPRTAETRRSPQDAAPNAFVTDQSLDDVILAYLSHGERKP
ncbi:MAG: hypothetical protein JXP73_15915 [Deltaproteobacteria bacterium]|nr:hypothetical protein [Deltaproteobacteria bacterium]